jgi:putative PIG3 family NAD(P)H quinone oxidoreductase
MKAIEVVAAGDQARLVLAECEMPATAPHEVLIKVMAAGVNRADILQKKGKYKPPSGASAILGLEVAGEVVETCYQSSGFKVGDRVCALLEGGGYAEYVSVNAGQVLPIPAGLDSVQAASLPEAVFTVWSNLFDHADMKAGQSLLVHGGTSGIGVMAVQMAKAFGIRCFATAGSDKKCEFLRQLGVEKAINYKTQDFVTEVGSVDVVLDMVGGDYFPRNIKVLAQGGKLLSIAFLGGAKAEVNFAEVLFKNLTIMGTTLRSKTQEQKAQMAENIRKHVWPLIESGQIKPVVDSVFALEDAEKAHELMESSGHIGKIVLNVAQ